MSHSSRYTQEELTVLMEELIPFNAYIGLQFEWINVGEARITLPARAEYTGDPFRPALHGGLTATLVDTVGGAAVFTSVDKGNTVSTIDLRIDYLLPGNPDLPLVACGTVVRQGNKVAVTQITCTQEDKGEVRTIATGNGVYYINQSKVKILQKP